MVDYDAVIAALGRELEFRLPDRADLTAAAGEPADQDRLDRALNALVRYVAFTPDDPPRVDDTVDALREALEREQVYTDPAATAAAVKAAETIMASAPG